ncbi:hypothetical protein STSP2_00830 [Anaerohalosphaera lusitana]|uniref:DUF2207 domain-containing protein n=1 Tax=Anaerohalosphaera lusitana TaxID=1936003 RepID=A0A1U9NIB8_9BACT|nr:DUF2330 domain-containing protein [Anaerohalosphaera lusitana]AQT67682.1 hypothetical protein STSP2_00830 [Anaerohalosphaera lusitana]
MKKLITTALLLTLILPAAAHADGKIFPRAHIKAKLAMPSQRAIISYRDGIETLIVESSFEGPGEEFGWIIPVPNEPTQFKAATPGLLDTLELNLRPKITHINLEIIVIALAALLVALWILLDVLVKRKPFLIFLSCGTILVFIVSVLTIYFFPVRSQLKLNLDQYVNETAEQTLHALDLNVFTPDNTDQINDWLTANGCIPLANDKSKIITDYAADGWHFITAKLLNDGAQTDHLVTIPLKIVFPTNKPIYPARLITNTDGTKLDLFIIGPEKAQAKGLNTIFADEFHKNDYQANINDQFEILDGSVFTADRFHRTRLSTTAVDDILWDNSFVTRLEGENLTEDLPIKFNGTEAERDLTFTDPGATLVASAAALIVAAAILTFIRTVGAKRIFSQTTKSIFPFVLPAIALCALAVFIAIYATLDRSRIGFAQNWLLDTGFADRFQTKSIYYTALDTAENLRQANNFSIQNMQAEMKEYTKDMTNYYHGRKGIEQGDSPGDYQLLEDERGIVLRTYTQHGTPIEMPLRKELENLKSEK